MTAEIANDDVFIDRAIEAAITPSSRRWRSWSIPAHPDVRPSDVLRPRHASLITAAIGVRPISPSRSSFALALGLTVG